MQNTNTLMCFSRCIESRSSNNIFRYCFSFYTTDAGDSWLHTQCKGVIADVARNSMTGGNPA